MAFHRPPTVFVFDYSHELNTTILAQFCGARTEPFTGHVSYVLCKDFKVSIKGQRNMNNGLNNLPIYRTPDERLTFGWAEQNLIRTQLVHQGAYEHLAIMIALSETFHESYSARVMWEMAQVAAGYQDITPHFRQWRNVIHSLNGAFSTTDFGVVVEDYIRLDPYNVITGLDASTAQIPVHAKTLGEALLELGKVSNGKEKQITITGSAILGWLAAVADWLYDLRIAIFSNTGEHLHSTDPGKETQVLFVFEPTPGCRVSNKPWSTDSTQASQTTKSASELTLYSTSIHNTPMTGRVVWQSLLPRIFGRSFYYLDHEDSRPFATMLGAAARLFQALATDEDPEDERSTNLVSTSTKSNTSSYGPGLIQTLTNWMPELRRFQGKMERQLKLQRPEAAQAYRESLNALRKVCDCGICKPLPMNPEPANPDPDLTLPNIDKLSIDPDIKIPEPAPKNGYCLPTLVETIIALGLALSRTVVSSALYPSRAGIQSLYHSQSLRRLASRGLHWTQHFTLIYGNEWNAPDHRRLINTIQIFSGSKPKKYLPENLMAVAHEGITAYFTDLEKINLGRKRGVEPGVRLIRIVSGGINVRYKVFQRLCVGEVRGEDWDDPWERVQVEHVEEVLCCK